MKVQWEGRSNDICEEIENPQLIGNYEINGSDCRLIQSRPFSDNDKKSANVDRVQTKIANH